MAIGDTQAKIAAWAEGTFGPVSGHGVLVRRAQLELDELLQAVEAGDKTEIGKETADVAILLYRLMALNGLDFDTEVAAKMAENRARRWQPKGDGTGSHITE